MIFKHTLSACFWTLEPCTSSLFDILFSLGIIHVYAREKFYFEIFSKHARLKTFKINENVVQVFDNLKTPSILDGIRSDLF